MNNYDAICCVVFRSDSGGGAGEGVRYSTIVVGLMQGEML